MAETSKPQTKAQEDKMVTIKVVEPMPKHAYCVGKTYDVTPQEYAQLKKTGCVKTQKELEDADKE